MSSTLNTANLINLLLARLINPDIERIKRQMDTLIERAHEYHNTGAAREAMTIALTQPQVLCFVHSAAAKNNTSVTPIPVEPAPRDVEAMAVAATDLIQTEKGFKAMRQTLAQLLHGVSDGQTIRNALPECVFHLIRVELPFERTAEEGCTIRDHTRNWKQFQETLNLFKVYAAAGVLLEE